jgi:hypothetical protein
VLWIYFDSRSRCHASGRMRNTQDVELKLMSKKYINKNIDETNPSLGVTLRYKNGDIFDQNPYGKIKIYYKR